VRERQKATKKENKKSQRKDKNFDLHSRNAPPALAGRFIASSTFEGVSPLLVG
jgi:hypothetical protein